MKHVVGVSDMKISSNPGSFVITHSLGSCVGISVYDPVNKIGGILHYQLPTVSGGDAPAGNPYKYAETGIPAFFKKICAMGAIRKQLVVKAAGGANLMDPNGFFNIGKRNVIAMRKLFWKNGILMSGEDLGGECWRTLRLDIDTGRVTIKNNICEKEL
jgi:chemotaxis protein CheD